MATGIWLTLLSDAGEPVKKLMSMFKTYGIGADGHVWENDLEKAAWIKARANLLDKKISMWAIFGTDEELSDPDIRYGLSLLSMTVTAQKGQSFPIIVIQNGGNPVVPESLPTSLRHAQVLQASNAALGAKITAKIHTPSKTISEYRLDAFGHAQTGQWIEIGPCEGTWKGAMLGIDEGEISFHAVGPGGRLPERSVLEYPVKGIELATGDRKYTAWAVANELDTENSYYVQIKGCPKSLIFGAYASDEEAELYTLTLK